MKAETTIFENTAPHPEPVSIAELLNDIEAVIKRHVIIPDHVAAALAVWVLHTYTFELRDTVAYVAIESPEKRCGKTTLLSVLAAMAHKPLIASNVTVSALFRAIDTCSPALFIDEADTFLAGNGAMRGIINSGNTWRTAYVLRLARGKANRGQSPAQKPSSASVQTASAESIETGLKKFSCWCPKVIAMIGRVPDTIADRSIVVQMSRKLVDETCAPLAELNTTAIRAKCVRFALDAGRSIAQSPRIQGEGLNDRAADTFDPLYVIARLAGNGWEEKLHAAALALNAVAESENSGAELLLEIYFLLAETRREKIFSSDLALEIRGQFAHLPSLPLNHASINERQLARFLRPYGIKARTIRMGNRVTRGYVADDFLHAVARYVPKADVQARLGELHQRAALYTEARAEADAEAEAKAEAEKQAAQAHQQPARAPVNSQTAVQLTEAMLKWLKKGAPDDDNDDFEDMISN